MSKMQVVCGGQSLWIFLLFTSLQLWGRLSASASTAAPLPPPPPTLFIHSRSKCATVVACRAPAGHRGDTFMLFRENREKVDSRELQSSAEEVLFTVRVSEWDSVQLFCCLYLEQGSPYSPFSPYLKLETPKGTAPACSLPPPVLSVDPPGGAVKRGDTLSFTCSAPVPSGSRSRPSHGEALTFLLLGAAERTGPPPPPPVVLEPRSSRGSSAGPQPGVFSVGPVSGGEGGGYKCIYQVTRGSLVNSSVSNVVHITITDALPVPTLVLQQQTGAWRLRCTGPPAYPGAVFSLYPAASNVPVATQRAANHQVTFQVPVQDTPVASYQCQYDVPLGSQWAKSERSLPLAVTRGFPDPSPTDLPAVDWPLVLGSFSAGVLFLAVVALVVVVSHRKVKAVAEEKKRRQDAQFWTKVHAKDHVVDLTLRRTSFPTQEWERLDSITETASRSPLWNAHSTFTTPIR